MAPLSRQEKEREARKAEIVVAAEKIFRRRGFADATMDEIAKAAQFTKRTVYQYFVNKEDLLFAVALEGNRRLHASQQVAFAEGGSGLARFHRAAMAYYRFCRDLPDLFRLMEDARRIGAKEESGPNRQELTRFRHQMLIEYAEVFEQGKADGSIRADLDTKQGVYAIVLILAGFFQMLSETVKAGGLDLDPEAFVPFALDLLADALRTR